MAGKTYTVEVDIEVQGDEQLANVEKTIDNLKTKSGGVDTVFKKISTGVKTAGTSVKAFGGAIAGAFGGAVFSLVTRIIDAFVQMEPVAKALEYAFTFIEVAVSKAGEAFNALLSLDFGKLWDIATSVGAATSKIIELEKAVKSLDTAFAGLEVRMGNLTYIAELHKKAMDDTTRSFSDRREQAKLWYDQMLLVNKEQQDFLQHQISLVTQQLALAKSEEERIELQKKLLGLQGQLNTTRREAVGITENYTKAVKDLNKEEKEVLENNRVENIDSMKSFSGNVVDIKKEEGVLLGVENKKIVQNDQSSFQQRRGDQLAFMQAGLSVLSAGFAIAEELAKDDFEKQKKIRIANVITQGLMGVVGAWAGAFMTPLPTPAQIALGAISTALIAGVTALNVSRIASQQPTGGGGSSVGSSFGGGSISAPSFSQVSPLTAGEEQLSTAIAQETAEPTKAYVVSSEMTTNQELDRHIETNAGL